MGKTNNIFSVCEIRFSGIKKVPSLFKCVLLTGILLCMGGCTVSATTLQSEPAVPVSEAAINSKASSVSAIQKESETLKEAEKIASSLSGTETSQKESLKSTAVTETAAVQAVKTETGYKTGFLPFVAWEDMVPLDSIPSDAASDGVANPVVGQKLAQKYWNGSIPPATNDKGEYYCMNGLNVGKDVNLSADGKANACYGSGGFVANYLKRLNQ